jgi:hypothetical protein
MITLGYAMNSRFEISGVPQADGCLIAIFDFESRISNLEFIL